MTIPSPQSQYNPTRNSTSSLSPPNSPLSSTPSTLTSHFVQALHDYLPSSVSPDEAVSCLFFKKGAIIEVFNRDDSGWWDGQCGNVRGWFPSNYVGRIGELKRQITDFEDETQQSNEELKIWQQKMNRQLHDSSSNVPLEEHHNKISPIIQNRAETTRTSPKEDKWKPEQQIDNIHALIEEVSKQVNSLVDACANPIQSNIQLHVFQVVASVRSVLTEANVVNKESTLLKMYPELAQQRKIVLSALSRLVLKGKSFQQQQPVNNHHYINQNDDHISYLADQLLNEVDLFEKLLFTIPQQSTLLITAENGSLETTRPSSMFQFDTPRSSVSSLGYSSIVSTQSGPFRQQQPTNTLKTRHSNNSISSLVTKAATLSDKEYVLQSILDQQAFIDELMASLVMTLERYLIVRHRATEILEITRKAVEAVRTFLAVVEHVYSNMGEIDQSQRMSIIPEDPSLVSLVLTKESVYSAITNLVTAVRALTGPQQYDQDRSSILKDDFDHLCLCCENVVRAINECAAYVRACLRTEDDDDRFQQLLLRNIQEISKSEFLADNNYRSDALNSLRRKASSLQAIQQFRDSQTEKMAKAEKAEEEEAVVPAVTPPTAAAAVAAAVATVPEKEDSPTEQVIEDLAIETVSNRDIYRDSDIIKAYSSDRSYPRTSTSSLTLNTLYHSPPSPLRSSTPSLSTSTNSSTTKTNTSTASAVDTIIPETNPVRRTKLRPRAASVNTSLSFQQLPPAPPLPPKNNMKPSISAAFPLPPCIDTAPQDITRTLSTEPQPLKSRRSRGLSVSSIKSTMNKSKLERSSTTASSDHFSFTEPLRIQKMPSWMSMNTTVNRSENNSLSSIESTPTLSSNNRHIKKEPEFEFLKQPVFTEDEMIFNAEGEVTGATIDALVRKLTLHEKSPDLVFTRAFFYNFRLFTKPKDFVGLLTDRFTLQPPKEPEPLTDDQLALWTNRVLIPIRLRVYNVIKTWLETYFNYEQDASVETALTDFASNEMSKAMPGPAKRMLELIKRTFASKGLSCTGCKHIYTDSRVITQKSSFPNLQSSGSNGSIFSNLTLFDDHHHHFDSSIDKYPPSILGKSLRNTLRKALNHNTLTIVHVNDFDPAELARQLTLMENNLFCRIRPNEMIGQEFKKKVGTSQAVHVKAMIQRSTQITSWVSDTILRETDTKKRSQVLKYWIKVGDACLQLNNYNTLMAIRSALDSTSIARLKRTWDHLSVKYRTMWEPVYRATDSQRNFAEYRQRLKSTVAPCLPFLGVYLTDMTFIDDGNADYRMSPGGKRLINFDKYIKFTRILNEIDQFQIPYKLFEVEEIQTYLKKTLESVEQDDQVFYARSLKREPKEEEVIA